jgi:three-Cys-motif partner protein
MTETHGFGGSWTEKKLKQVEKYLKAYATIMNKHKQKFRFAYIDAFAGTGYIEEKKNKIDGQISLFQQNDIKEIEAYSKGSARIALEIKPEFDKYILLKNQEKILQNC